MNKKITGTMLAAVMIAGTTSFSAFAAMGNGTVVIGTKAFSLAYANDPANVAEIGNAILTGGSTVFVKGFDGKWINNTTGLAVDASAIPAVTYKSATGVVSNFDAGDQDAVTTTTVKSVSAINVNKLKVTFNAPVVDTTKPVFAVTRGTVTEAVTTTWNTDKTEATLTRTAGTFVAGDYKVVVSGIDIAADSNSGTATVQDEVVNSVAINTASLQKSATAPLSVDFINQYGEKATVLATDSKLKITAFDTTTSAVVNLVPAAFQLNAAALTAKDEVVVTVLYNGVKATKTLTVVNAASVGSVVLSNAVLPTGKTMFTPSGTTAVEIPYTAANTLGEDYKLVTGNAGVQFLSSDSTIVDPADITIDANNKIHIAQFKKAGVVAITVLTPATGNTSSINITVNENAGAPYAATLEKASAQFAAGSTAPVYVGVTVADKYNTNIVAKDLVSSDYVISTDNNLVASAVLGTGTDIGKIVVTPVASTTKGQSAVITVLVKATGQKSTFTVSASDAALPTSIVTKKDTTISTNLLAGATQTMNLDVQDQYATVLGATGTYTVGYTTSDATVVNITSTETGDAIDAAAVEVSALKAGTATIKAQLKKDGVVIGEKAYTITVGANDSTKTTYSVGDIPVLYNSAAVTTTSLSDMDAAVNSGYAKEVKISATDASGNVYLVPSTSILSVTSSDANLKVAQATNGKWYTVSNNFGAMTADKVVTLSATINASDTVKTISKDVTVSKDASKVASVSFKDSVANVTNEATAKDVDTLSMTNKAAYTSTVAGVYEWSKDQFGGYVLGSTFKVVPVDGITDGSTDTATVTGGNLDITDAGTATAFTKNSATFRVVGINGSVSDFITFTVADAVAPTAPTVAPVVAANTTVTGTGEVGSTITVTGATTLGTAVVAANGTYSVTIAAQPATTVLSVTATDAALNVSTVTAVTVGA